MSEDTDTLESPCPRCGEKALVKIEAAGFGAFGGAIECKSCTAKSTLTWGESLLGDTSWREAKP